MKEKQGEVAGIPSPQPAYYITPPYVGVGVGVGVGCGGGGGPTMVADPEPADCETGE